MQIIFFLYKNCIYVSKVLYFKDCYKTSSLIYYQFTTFESRNIRNYKNICEYSSKIKKV